jgi:hypothetical protein
MPKTIKEEEPFYNAGDWICGRCADKGNWVVVNDWTQEEFDSHLAGHDA